MAEWWDWDDSGSGSEMYTGGSPTFNEGWGSVGSQADMPWAYPMPADTPGWEDFTGWGDPTGPGTSGDTSGGNWLSNLLGGAGSFFSGAGSFLRPGSADGGTGIGGPLLSALGSLGGGAIGSNAANEAARLQSQALNRGIDLQTAQWLQQQQNLAPYLQAGQ